MAMQWPSKRLSLTIFCLRKNLFLPNLLTPSLAPPTCTSRPLPISETATCPPPNFPSSPLLDLPKPPHGSHRHRLGRILRRAVSCGMVRDRSAFDQLPGRQAHSLVLDRDGEVEDRSADIGLEKQVVGSSLGSGDQIKNVPASRLSRDGHIGKVPSDMEMMKERFAKLLLGEDMSGGGKGVSSALALSNAITNLAASVFGEQWRLEPMSAERKARWRKEIDWLLSVTDHIVEFVPSQQKTRDGSTVEVMITRQRADLLMSIPALRKLDAMLIDYLDNFKDRSGFWYVKRESEEGDKSNGPRQGDKWWLPKPQVPPEGLPEMSRKWLHYQKDSVNQVLKAAMAINAHILSEMEIPEDYIESLPKNGRESLGDSLYRSITVDYFDPEQFLSTLDLSTEHKVLDLKNRIEASVVIWKRKMNNKDSKSTWGSAVSLEKRELFEERAETILVLLKQKFPGIPQSALDISKIQYNKDVGQSVIESYSRILESLSFTVMSRIEDVLYADYIAQNPLQAQPNSAYSLSNSPVNGPPVKLLNPAEEIEKLTTMNGPTSLTLSDFMGWQPVDQEPETKKRGLVNFISKLQSNSFKGKAVDDNVNSKKISYIEKLENNGGLRSPSDRH